MMETPGPGPAGPTHCLLFERAVEQLNEALTRARGAPANARRPARPESAGDPPVRPGARRLDELLGGIVACTEGDKGTLQVYDPRAGLLHIHAQRGFSAEFVDFFQTLRTHEAACGLAFATQATVVVSDVATSPVFSEPARRLLLREDARAVQSTTLTTSTARKVGVVSVHYRRPGVPPEGQELLRHFAPHLAEVIALCGWADGAS